MNKSLIWLLVILIVIMLYVPTQAEQFAVAQDGSEVLLKDDGTWEYVQKKKTASSFGFRKVKWGASKNQVKKIENLEIAQEEENILIYKGKLSTFKD